MKDAALTRAVQEAAEALEAQFPDAHFICIGVKDGFISLHAKTPAINDKLEAIAALQRVADQTAETTAVEVAEKLNPPKGKTP